MLSDYPLTRGGQNKNPLSQFSRYHGLVITHHIPYASHITYFVTNITSGGISIWFHKVDTVAKALFSACNDLNQTAFSILLDGYTIKLRVGESIVSSSILPIIYGKWQHLLLYWDIGENVTIACILDKGMPIYLTLPTNNIM